jgi:quercetin dioxygenase-like cupin family protein
LSQIERGLSNPSVKALHSISGALEVTIIWFFKDTEHEDFNERRFIVRADKRRQFQFEGRIKDEFLSPSLSGELELLRCTFAPGAVCGYMHKGEEAGIILSGTLEFWLGDDHYILNEGDSFGFCSDEPHRYRNCGDTEAVVIWSLAPPFY